MIEDSLELFVWMQEDMQDASYLGHQIRHVCKSLHRSFLVGQNYGIRVTRPNSEQSNTCKSPKRDCRQPIAFRPALISGKKIDAVSSDTFIQTLTFKRWRLTTKCRPRLLQAMGKQGQYHLQVREARRLRYVSFQGVNRCHSLLLSLH